MNGQYETIFLSYNKTMLGNTSLPVNLNFPLYKLNLLNFKPSCEHTVVLPDRVQGRIQEFVQGGLSPNIPPPEYASDRVPHYNFEASSVEAVKRTVNYERT